MTYLPPWEHDHMFQMMFWTSVLPLSSDDTYVQVSADTNTEKKSDSII
jgi:hypothetical protein